MVRLTIRGGGSAPSALTVGKCEMLTHFSIEMWFFDTENTFYLVRGLKSAFFISLTTPLYCYPTILWQGNSSSLGLRLTRSLSLSLCLCYCVVQMHLTPQPVHISIDALGQLWRRQGQNQPRRSNVTSTLVQEERFKMEMRLWKGGWKKGAQGELPGHEIKIPLLWHKTKKRPMGGNVNRDFASYDLLVLWKFKVDKKRHGMRMLPICHHCRTESSGRI